jgi:hypothetical protein
VIRFIGFSLMALFFLDFRRKNQMRRMSAIRNARPPRTPPTMAPTLALEPELEPLLALIVEPKVSCYLGRMKKSKPTGKSWLDSFHPQGFLG